MKMICPHCNIEMVMGFRFYSSYMLNSFKHMGFEDTTDNMLYKDINGHPVSFVPLACVCPKCKKIEWYAYTPKPKKSKADDYKNLY